MKSQCSLDTFTSWSIYGFKQAWENFIFKILPYFKNTKVQAFLTYNDVSLLSLSHHKVQRKRWKCGVFLFRWRRRRYNRNCKTLKCMRWNGSIICNFCAITICSVSFQFSPFKHAEDVRIADKTAAPQCCNTQEQNLQCSRLKTLWYKEPAYHSRTYFQFSPIKYTVLNLVQRNIKVLTSFTLGYGT